MYVCHKLLLGSLAVFVGQQEGHPVSLQQAPKVFIGRPASLCFNGHFPGEPRLAGVYWSKAWTCLPQAHLGSSNFVSDH